VRAGSRIDFRQGSFEECLLSGFSWWESSSRWTAGDSAVRLQRGSGDLAIEAYAPMGQLRNRFRGLTAIRVKVSLDGTPVGEFQIERDDITEYRIPMRTGTRTGETVVIGLEPNQLWHARDIAPASMDDRDLNFALISIGYTGEAHPLPTSCESSGLRP
jgi:hypothetical protein